MSDADTPPFKVGDRVRHGSGGEYVVSGVRFELDEWLLNLECGAWGFACLFTLVEAAEHSPTPVSACTCEQLLWGCTCGGGAAEIAATTRRWRNPVTGLWVAK